jgi:hypothetical protein
MEKLDAETKIKLSITKATKEYEELNAVLSKTYDELSVKHERLPAKIVDNKEDFENHMLFSAHQKHEALKLWKNAMAGFTSIDLDVSGFVSELKMKVAETFLQEHGFDRATDALREAFVMGVDELRSLMKIRAHLEVLAKVSERLVRSFEGDETNCRKIMDKINTLSGIK